MAIHTTYTAACGNLAKLLDEIVESWETVVIERRGREPVAMIAASELAGLAETAHLLRSPANAERLLRALHRARSRTLKPRNPQEIRRELGLEVEG